MRQFAVAGLLALASALIAPSALWADPIHTWSIPVPDFIIPVGGEYGTLTVDSAGNVTTGGFNVLGNQTFTLDAGQTSTGSMTLNLEFLGSPLGDPAYSISDAALHLSVFDLDFLKDNVTTKIALTEVAILDSVNGTTLGALEIDLEDFLPPGTSDTDDEAIDLLPIPLDFLSSADFTDPFTLSLTLSATVTNAPSWKGGTKVTLLNTPESLVPKLELTAKATSVPEPSTALGFSLLSLGLAAFYRRRDDSADD